MMAKRQKIQLDVPSVQLQLPPFVPSVQLQLPPFVQIGKLFEKYDNIDKVGYGAFGSVYQAKSRSGGNLKAIKVLNALPHETAKIMKALNEAEIGMKIDHPNILSIDEVWYDGTRFFFVMDLITPISVSILPESPKDKLMLFQQLVSAVTYLYSQGILHRDIKITNTGLKLGKDEKLHLVLYDFGEACKKSEHCRECIGTVLNISPEVLEHFQYTDRSEVWALMCYLVELLTGKPMILGLFDEPHGLIAAIHVQLMIDSLTEPPIPEVFKKDKSSAGLLILQILRRGLAIDPEKRLTLLELQALLQQLLEDL